MEEFIKKITSYNLLNNLLPGVVFSFFVEKSTSFSFLSNDWTINIFLFYFYGCFISRLGSLIVEPAVQHFEKFAPYKDYLQASSRDKLIVELNETNNYYRTMIAVFSVIVIIILIDFLASVLSIDLHSLISKLTISSFLAIIFIFSYIKQIKYIKQRITKALLERQK